ncbi:MAG: hypothetical protein WD271_01975 [Acidimicrobiia bacterium]
MVALGRLLEHVVIALVELARTTLAALDGTADVSTRDGGGDGELCALEGAVE